jgi:16S rRNA (uracil1498-N3)-methyltransferase
VTRVRLDVPVLTGDVVTLDDAQAHHLLHVLRLEGGAEVDAVDREGRLFRATLLDSDPPAVEIGHHLPKATANPASSLEVWLPLLKGGRTDDLVRQLTEIGATRIVPFVTSRTVARPEADRAERKLERWRAIASEATRQCGRTDVPEVPDGSPFEGLPGAPAAGPPGLAPGVFLWEGGGAPASEALAAAALHTPGRLAVLVGPEGGHSPEEARALEDAGWLPATLGPRVLRAETAVVAAAVLALAALGEAGYGPILPRGPERA